MTDYDAIVVGGGHNGLTAGAYLARAGLRVCVVERRDILGGACVTEEVWPGHRISRASYVVSLLQPTVVKDLRLKDFGYEVHPLDPAYAAIDADGRVMFFHNDQQKTVESLAQLLEEGRCGAAGLRGSARADGGVPAPADAQAAADDRLQAPGRPVLAAARGGARRRALQARRPRLLPRDDDVGRRPARRLVRERPLQGRDRLDRRRRRVGRAAHAGHRLQPAAPRARRDRRRVGPVGPRQGRHGRDLDGDREVGGVVGRGHPHRRGRPLDRRPRRARARRDARVGRGASGRGRRLRGAPQDDGARPGGGRALPGRGRRGPAALQDARRVGEGQLGALRAPALRGRDRRGPVHAAALRRGVLPLDRLPRARLAGRGARAAVGGAVPRGRGADDDRRHADRRRRDRGDDVHPVRALQRGGLARGLARALRAAVPRHARRGGAERQGRGRAPRGARAAGPRAHLRAARRQHLPGRAGPGPDGVHAPDAGAGAVRDAGRRPLPVRRGDAPGRRGHGRRRAQRGQADPARPAVEEAAARRSRRATATNRRRRPSRCDDARPHGADAGAGRAPVAGAPLRRGGAVPARGEGRAGRRQAAGRGPRADPLRGDGGRAARRAARPRTRRAGLVEARVGVGRGAVRALDQRPLVAHPDRVQRARVGVGGADRALAAAGAAGRGPRRLRGDRGARGLGPVGDRDDRAPPRRRLGDRRREVVRHVRRHRDGLHRRGERGGGGADAVPRRRDVAGDLRRRRPAVHAHLSARASDDPLRGGRGLATAT